MPSANGGMQSHLKDPDELDLEITKKELRLLTKRREL